MADLVGTWTLSRWVSKRGDEETEPFGGAEGFLVYTADGFMSAVLTARDRAHRESQNPLGGTPEERAAAAATYLSYCGRYTFDDERVTHHVEASLYPNWVGTDQVREATFLTDDHLRLSTPPSVVRGVERSAVLEWRRLDT